MPTLIISSPKGEGLRAADVPTDGGTPTSDPYLVIDYMRHRRRATKRDRRVSPKRVRTVNPIWTSWSCKFEDFVRCARWPSVLSGGGARAVAF